MLKWEFGRQDSLYYKMLLFKGLWPLPFDVWLLKYVEGSHLPEHTDPVEKGDHWRLNTVLWKPKAGGVVLSKAQTVYSGVDIKKMGDEYPITFKGKYIKWNKHGRVHLFRPDITPHRMLPVREGTRYVLSIGWIVGG